jgi:hypothetical protein
VDGVTSRPSVTFHQHPGSPGTVQVVWRFSTSSQLIPCHFRRVLRLSLLGVEWRWTNWCGGDVRVRFRGGEVDRTTPPSGGLLVPSTRPACVDPFRPTRLKHVEWGA